MIDHSEPGTAATAPVPTTTTGIGAPQFMASPNIASPAQARLAQEQIEDTLPEAILELAREEGAVTPRLIQAGDRFLVMDAVSMRTWELSLVEF